jgi:hypothetical protein
MQANSKSSKMHVETVTAKDRVNSQLTDKVFEGDVGLHVFSNIHAVADDIDPHAEKRLVRKIDCFIIPLICMT